MNPGGIPPLALEYGTVPEPQERPLNLIGDASSYLALVLAKRHAQETEREARVEIETLNDKLEVALENLERYVEPCSSICVRLSDYTLTLTRRGDEIEYRLYDPQGELLTC